TNGTWNHALAVFASSTSRAAYLNGASKGTNVQSSSPTGVNRTTTSMVYVSAASSLFFPGDLAEVAMWNVALTDADAAILA
ncbi:LamG-like jellyroll fold domain-containing protein, partial [Stenotrophomonas geniculata]|uniref:LamG-like jellyroll fold domain-containing protein n=1 Tax=Stenotrophomonas geniculata TaxID=86188 RepID=UPI0039B001C3